VPWDWCWFCNVSTVGTPDAVADSLLDHLGTAGFLGALGLFVVCFGAGGGLRFPGIYSNMVRSFS